MNIKSVSVAHNKEVGVVERAGVENGIGMNIILGCNGHSLLLH